jgi:hypothetical protein
MIRNPHQTFRHYREHPLASGGGLWPVPKQQFVEPAVDLVGHPIIAVVVARIGMSSRITIFIGNR